MQKTLATTLGMCILGVFGLNFWGYSLDGLHYSDLLYFFDELPPLWGLSLVDAQSKRINYEFLYHNEGIMVLLYGLIQRLPLGIEDKLVFVNGLSLSLQLLNVLLFTWVFRKIVGAVHLALFVLLYLIYPFASSTHYWLASVPNSLAVTFFLGSLGLFLRVKYESTRVLENIALRIIPSLALLWLSIITVEWAICMSPLYVYLALYYSNGRTALFRFSKPVTPYSALASVFLLTSICPVYLFATHNLTVISYAPRYRELAEQARWSSALTAAVIIVGNAVLTGGSYLFANTIGLVVYPITDLVQHLDFLRTIPVRIYISIGLVAVLCAVCWKMTSPWWTGRGRGEESFIDFKFLFVLGVLWTILAYFPFLLTFRYPRNVGLFSDRVNQLGSMGVVLSLGSLLCIWQTRWMQRNSFSPKALFAAIVIVACGLLLSVQIQKAMYFEAELKERTLVGALLDTQTRLSEQGREPIFLVNRASKIATSRAKLRLALKEPVTAMTFINVGDVILDRYFVQPVTSSNFHFYGIDWFLNAGFINFYADRRGQAKPLVYRWEDPLRLLEGSESYTLGYSPTEAWQKPQAAYQFSPQEKVQSYSKQRYELVVMEIGEPTFRLGGPLVYAFKPYAARRPGS